MEQNYFDTLIADFLSGTISEQNRSIFFNEISKNPDAKRRYFEQALKWIERYPGSMSKAERIRIFHKIEKKISATQRKTLFYSVYRLTAVAASLLLLFGTGFLLGRKEQNLPNYVHHYVEQTPDTLIREQITEMVIPRGSRSQIIMPDGTKIWVNADSKIHYSTQYAKTERNIYLEGEAYFEVAKDTGSLFRVYSGDLCITATGTSFNVDAYSANIKTTLLEGSVNIASKGGKIHHLKPNQSVEFNNAQADFKSVNHVRTELYTSWKDDRWIIREMNLLEFTQKLEKKYDVHISFLDESIEQHKISAILTTETIEQVMQALKTSLHIDYSISKNMITIFSSTTPHL